MRITKILSVALLLVTINVGLFAQYSVSGTVRLQSGAGVTGVLIYDVGKKNTTTTAGPQGMYSLTVKNGQNTITPEKEGFTFDPPQIQLNVDRPGLSANFIASGSGINKQEYSVSGNITVCDEPLQGVKVESRGKTVFTDVDGNYIIKDSAENHDMFWDPMDFSVTASKEGFIFNDSVQNIHFIGNLVITNINYTAVREKDTISGKVTHPNDLPFSGVSIELEISSSGSEGHGTPVVISDTIITTDVNGIYSILFANSVDQNSYSIKIKPLGDEYAFSPADMQLSFSQSCGLKDMNFTAAYIPVPICMVSVSENNKNIVVWEKPETDVITGFKIYREGDQANVYEIMDTVPYNSVAIYTDINSDPSTKAYRYKIGTLTTYDYETELSELHKTIHLTINQGVGNIWNLIWTNYEGLVFSTYKLYRGTNANDVAFLTDIASDLTSYTDNNPPEGIVYYQIEAVLPSSCNPEVAIPLLKSTNSADYSSSKSNIVNSANVSNKIDMGISDDGLKLFPNPSDKMLYLQYDKGIQQFEIYSLQGILLLKGYSGNNHTSIDVSGLAKGMYTIKVKSNSGWLTHKFVK